jgi:hypothetical protein
LAFETSKEDKKSRRKMIEPQHRVVDFNVSWYSGFKRGEPPKRNMKVA